MFLTVNSARSARKPGIFRHLYVPETIEWEMLGLDASFGASAMKAIEPSMTKCLDHVELYPDRIQDAMQYCGLVVPGVRASDRKCEIWIEAFRIYRHLSLSSRIYRRRF